MEEIKDKRKLENYFEKQKNHFQQKPSVIRLVKFEKKELLSGPLHPLESFYIVVAGSIFIYHIKKEGEIRYITKAGTGTLLGDLEFSGAGKELFYTEAAETVICLAVPFRENRDMLEKDPMFLRFIVEQLAEKLALSSSMEIVAQTLEEKVLHYLRNIQPNHEILSVNQAIQILHCSRRQLQRVLKKLCDEKIIMKTGRGCYRLKE